MTSPARTTFWAILLCLQTGFAQPEGTARFEFSVYGLRPGDFSNIHYEDARGEAKRLDFKRKRRSEPYEAVISSEDRVIKFLCETSSKRAGEKANYQEISRVQLSLNPDKMLFVFVPRKNSKSERAFQVLALQDTLSAARRGTVRVVNLTSLKLLGMFDGERFELPSLTCSQPFEAASKRQSDFSIVAEGASRYHLVYRNSFRIEPDSRAILFLSPPYRRVSLKLGGHVLYEESTSGAD